jgi:transketolase C-terminal domain/subunit
MTLREKIKTITKRHIEQGFMCMGMNLTAVGWVNGTVPDMPELIELPMCDIMNSGFAVGAALVGKRPMFIIRYQGFNWFNSIFFTNYAAKSKELWGRGVPVFIRSLAAEGGVGPTAGSSHHGIYYRMPGVNIAAPMTSNEYTEVYNNFMENDVPMYVSEHRKSFDTVGEYVSTICNGEPDFVLFPFSITRMEMSEVKQKLHELGIKVDIYHQFWITPNRITDSQIERLARSKFGGLVLDDDYPNGIAKQIAYELMLKSGKNVRALGIEEKTAGACPGKDNLPPSAEKIVKLIKDIYENSINKI